MDWSPFLGNLHKGWFWKELWSVAMEGRGERRESETREEGLSTGYPVKE